MKWFLARGRAEDMPKQGDKVEIMPRDAIKDSEWATCKSQGPERDCYVLKPTEATGKAYVSFEDTGKVEKMAWLDKPEKPSDYGIALVQIVDLEA